LKTDHCLHASMERTLPPAAAAAAGAAVEDVFLDAEAGGFFALVAAAFVALALGVPFVLAMVKVVDSVLLQAFSML